MVHQRIRNVSVQLDTLETSHARLSVSEFPYTIM